jgi:hypothetical protein
MVFVEADHGFGNAIVCEIIVYMLAFAIGCDSGKLTGG